MSESHYTTSTCHILSRKRYQKVGRMEPVNMLYMSLWGPLFLVASTLFFLKLYVHYIHIYDLCTCIFFIPCINDKHVYRLVFTFPHPKDSTSRVSCRFVMTSKASVVVQILALAIASSESRMLGQLYKGGCRAILTSTHARYETVVSYNDTLKKWSEHSQIWRFCLFHCFFLRVYMLKCQQVDSEFCLSFAHGKLRVILAMTAWYPPYFCFSGPPPFLFSGSLHDFSFSLRIIWRGLVTAISALPPKGWVSWQRVSSHAQKSLETKQACSEITKAIWPVWPYHVKKYYMTSYHIIYITMMFFHDRFVSWVFCFHPTRLLEQSAIRGAVCRLHSGDPLRSHRPALFGLRGLVTSRCAPVGLESVWFRKKLRLCHFRAFPWHIFRVDHRGSIGSWRIIFHKIS